MSGNKRSVAAVDTLWLNMDTPENLMVIEGVMMFADPIDVERATQVLQMRLPDRYPVFRQIPVASRNPLGGFNWVDAPDFDVHDHVVVAELDRPGDDETLQRYVSALMSRPLDRDKPLWEIHLVNGYRGGTAMVARFHHALADGTALARVLLELTDDAPDDDLAEADREQRSGAPDPGPSYSLPSLSDVVGSATGAVNDAVRGGLHTMSRIQTLADPSRFDDAMSLATSTPDIVNKLLLAGTPQSPLTGAVGVEKVAVWSEPHDLVAIKEAGKRNGATINDVMVAAVAGAIRSHIISHGGDPRDLSTMVPVNLRPLDQPLPRELGNKFALVMLSLPVGGDTPQLRLAEAKARMDTIKSSPEAVITFGVIEALGAISPQLARTMIDFFSAKGMGVTTNVPGPRWPRYFAGVPVTSVLGWAPSAGIQTLNECIFSFDGSIRVGFKADRDNVPDPHGLVSAFDTELQALSAL
ncbi:MAG: wax ester/triacylglycerol synthase family O-acyltransferase [Candidatus Nanopelagicales bacterium]